MTWCLREGLTVRDWFLFPMNIRQQWLGFGSARLSAVAQCIAWSTGNRPHGSDPTDNYSLQHTSQALFYLKMKFIFILSTRGVSESKHFLESTLKAWNSKPSNL